MSNQEQDKRKAELAQARAKAVELGVEGDVSKMSLARVKQAIEAKQAAPAPAAADSSSSSTSTPSPTDDDVTRRAIDVPRSRRAAAEDKRAKRAPSRGVYRDAAGRARILGAGEAVPDGWTREGDADLRQRASSVGSSNLNPHVAGGLPEDKAQRGPRG